MHVYPRVRRIAAENFYIKLIEQPDISDSHPAIELLLTNPWEQDMLEEEAKRMATDIASLLNVPFLMELTHSAREM